MQILLVDDDEDTRQLFSTAFVLAGHRASTAANGDEAIALVSRQRFDAVLMDIEMPKLNGWEVLKLIRQLPFGERVPVLMFSAYHGPAKVQRAIEAGAYTLLRKPMLPHHVIAITEKARRKRPSGKEGRNEEQP